MFRRAGLAGIAFLVLSEGLSVAGAPAFSAWEITQMILPGSDVNAITQTSDGAIWLVANGGACRYDGLTDLRVVDKAGMPVLPSEQIFASQDGTLWGWISSRPELQAFAGGQVRSVGPFNNDALRIRAVAERTSGEIVVGTNQGLFRLDRTSLMPLALQGTQHLEVNALLADASGAVLVAHKGGLARLQTDGKVVPLSLPTKTMQVQALARGQRGVWVASGEQFGLLQADSVHWKSTPPGLLPHSLAEDKRGRLWLADTAQLAVFENDKPCKPCIESAAALQALLPARPQAPAVLKPFERAARGLPPQAPPLKARWRMHSVGTLMAARRPPSALP